MLVHYANALVDGLILEDCPAGDLTTDALGIGDEHGHMTFAPRADVTVAGVELASLVLARCGCRPRALKRDGAAVAAGDAVLEADGAAFALHRGWKVAQNVLEYMTGIATRAAAICAEASLGHEGCPVAVTRKHFPGAKPMSLAAATAGGCVVHRAGLSETILVFDRHRAFLPRQDGESPVAALAARLPALRRKAPERPVTAEVETLDDAVTLARAGIDAIQLDRYPIEILAEAVAAIRRANPATRVLAAGGISAANARLAAASGVDALVTSWPYFGRPQDMRVTMRRA